MQGHHIVLIEEHSSMTSTPFQTAQALSADIDKDFNSVSL